MKRFAMTAFAMLLSGCGSENSSDLHVIGGTVGPNNTQVKGAYPAAIGIWSNNVDSCTAVRISTNDDNYIGQQMTYTNGDARRGNFVNSKREGEFILVTKSGSTYREVFVNDIRASSELIN